MRWDSLLAAFFTLLTVSLLRLRYRSARLCGVSCILRWGSPLSAFFTLLTVDLLWLRYRSARLCGVSYILRWGGPLTTLITRGGGCWRLLSLGRWALC